MNNVKQTGLQALIPHRVILVILTLVFGLFMATHATANTFNKTGTIVRTLTDSAHYGGCMLKLSTPIGNGCPNNGWVSLDCDAQFSDAGEGQRAYASALVAFSLGKTITVTINNSQQHDGYCVVRRLDIR